MDIAQFLTERENEREQAARRATAGPWSWTGDQCYAAEDCGDDHRHGWGHMGPDLDGAEGEPVLSSFGHDADQITVSRSDAEHIARYDPEWVLADVAAKRAVIALCSRDFSDDQAAGLAWDTLLALVHPYLDHPDADPAWRYAAVPQRWIVGPWISTTPER